MKFALENGRIFPEARNLVPGTGGAERQQWLLACGLVRHGHEVTIYGLGDATAADIVESGVRFRWIGPTSPWLAWPRILASEQPDFWYSRGADLYLGVLTTMARLAGARVIFGLANDRDCDPPHALARHPRFWPLYDIGLSGAHRIITQHPGQRDALPEPLRGKTVWVPSLLGPVAPESTRGDHVAWVGLFREPKRPHLLAELARRLPEIQFVVCGAPVRHRTSPGYAAGIVDLLRACPNIDYRGSVPQDEAQRVIASAQMLLSTSILEGFPNTFLQAWGAGVPVVSMDFDPAGAIQRSRGGVVASGLEETEAAIRRLVGNSDERNGLAAAGLRYVREVHDDDAVVRRFLAAIDS